jgi:hypothetical protein
MKGAATTFMLIMVITVLLISIMVGWTVMNTTGFFELNEITAVKQEFAECNNKIFETARTGSSNKCIFPVQRGNITGSTSEISYQIISRYRICDKSTWVLINPENNIWQMCDISGKNSILSLKWNYTNISFQFQQIGNVQVMGQSGSTIEMNRASMSGNQISLLLRIY